MRQLGIFFSTVVLVLTTMDVGDAEAPNPTGGRGMDENGKAIIRGSASRRVCYASQIGAKLDSDVLTGGGTDDTAVLQAALDQAPKLGGLHLIMDGAALVHGLSVHANTTIECLNASCGFFLAPQSNGPILRNAHLAMKGPRGDQHIALIGGTYNQDCRHQEHHVQKDGKDQWVFALEFYGVEDFTMRGLTIRNQRTFAMLMANWYRVTIDDVSIDLPDRMHAQNQDGLHFFGPGQFLTIRNIQGTAGDDFLALAPDEHDQVSSITDVLIDGVFLKDSDQGIRLLSCGEGRLDRVIIKNVTGTYRSFGFYIHPWRPGNVGSFGNIVFDTIDLRATKPNYDYTTPFLFRIGGKHESLTFRNISHHDPEDNRPLIEIGWPNADPSKNVQDTTVRSLTVEGLQIFESNPKSADASYIKVLGKVDRMILRDISVTRTDDMPAAGCLVETMKGAEIRTLMVHDVCLNRMGSLLRHEAGKIGVLQINNVLCSELKDTLLSVRDGDIGQLRVASAHGAPLLSLKGSGKAAKAQD